MKMTLKYNKRNTRAPSTYYRLLYAKYLKPLFQECVNAFVQELAANIHVDSGMSISAIQAFAQLGHNTNILAQYLTGFKVRTRKDGSTYYRKYDSTGFPGGPSAYSGVKSPTEGRNLGNIAVASKDYVIDYGSSTKLGFQLKFNIHVLQHYLHERSGRALNSGDWQSLEKARVAFLIKWDAGLDTQKITTEFVEWLINGN